MLCIFWVLHGVAQACCGLRVHAAHMLWRSASGMVLSRGRADSVEQASCQKLTCCSDAGSIATALSAQHGALRQGRRLALAGACVMAGLRCDPFWSMCTGHCSIFFKLL